MKPIFKNDFDCADDVFGCFNVPQSEREGVEILFADYTYEDYSGNANVLFARDGELYEVFGSHCSCFGLEGQWEPEHLDKSIALQIIERREGVADYREVVQAFLNRN